VHTERPADVGLAAALAQNMEQVARRFEGQGWSTKEHYRVKGSSASAPKPENRYLKLYRERLRAGGSSEKDRRISAQVCVLGGGR
jgi:hypothetical protein